MNIRETLENHRNATIGVSVVAILAAIGYIIRASLPGSPGQLEASTKAYYTTDDGKTLFADDANKHTPFDHDGAQAVRAVAFTCDGGQHHWVQFLEKHADGEAPPPDGSPARGGPEARAGGVGRGLLVKRPGDTEWSPASDRSKFTEICRPKVPPGMSGGTIESYNP